MSGDDAPRLRPRARPVSRIPSLGSRGEGWVGIQIVLFAVVAGAGILAPGTLDGSTGTIVTAAGGVAVIAGLGLAAAGLRRLQRASALTALPHPTVEAELVTDGVYARVRHPVYGGIVVAALGWAAIRASLPATLAAVALLLFFDLKRRREEAWLEERFAGYAAYRARTRRLLPWIF